MKELPKIKFTNWVKWKNRKEIKNSDKAGVYILAKFKDAPEEEADFLDKNIIYVGETCNNSLKGRWYQFDRSAFQSKDGHSGGWSYNDEFGDSGDDLYVAALDTQDIPNEIRHLFIRFVERKVILDFALKNGSKPKLNKK